MAISERAFVSGPGERAGTMVRQRVSKAGSWALMKYDSQTGSEEKIRT